MTSPAVVERSFVPGAKPAPSGFEFVHAPGIRRAIGLPHADIVEISKEPDIFLNAPGMTIARREALESQAAPPIPTIINLDRPEHRKYRQIASAYFTPRAIQSLQPMVERRARQIVDSLGREDSEFQRAPDHFEYTKSLFMDFWTYFSDIIADRREHPATTSRA